MPVSFTPIIKVLNPCEYDTPIKVMAVKKDDKLWWMHAPVVPTIVANSRNNVKIIEGGGDKFDTYLFSQLFQNVYMYNDLRMDLPQKFFMEGNVLYYFLDVDVETITIPLFYRSPTVSIMFTKFKDKPALKMSVTKSAANVGQPNPKRRRQDE